MARIIGVSANTHGWLMFDLTKFEVTRFEPPTILVRCRRTGETYLFSIGDNGVVTHDEARCEQGEARRIAIDYLAHH